eukprot:scaffold75295_cov65-Phaeocystis_antarctica.AAC.4
MGGVTSRREAAAAGATCGSHTLVSSSATAASSPPTPSIAGVSRAGRAAAGRRVRRCSTIWAFVPVLGRPASSHICSSVSAVFRMSDDRIESSDVRRRRRFGGSTGVSSSSSSASASASQVAIGGAPGNPEEVTAFNMLVNARSASSSSDCLLPLLPRPPAALLPRPPLPPVATVERLAPSGRTTSGSSRTTLRRLSKPKAAVAECMVGRAVTRTVCSSR